MRSPHRCASALLLPVLLLCCALPAHAGEPLRVLLRGGPKTHGPGQHEHTLWLAEWRTLLGERGCAVDSATAFPSAAQLDAADVLVMYAADAGSIHGDERARLERFLSTGGGIVVLHDAVCGDAPEWFRDVVGGAWEHGHSKWLEGEIGLCLADREHPITRGAESFDLDDEIYWDLHMAPGAHVLANSFHTPFDVKPQMWTYEPGAYRAFVAIPGHRQETFSNPAYRTLLLRGVAWAAGRDADLLVTPDELAGLRYPPGGPLAPERAHEAIALHEDFELSLVAAEPLIPNPISVEWDPRGRMWVACSPGYPDKSEFSGLPPRDFVAILEDADGDGRMDGRTVFHEGLDLVTSLVLHRDGVIVSQSPDILWLRDADGDDRCDEVVTLYTGFGYGDTHATVSNLRWGLDGWVYATQGYSGGASDHVVGLDGVDHGRIGNGLFRFRPDGSAIEMVVSYGSNTWGLDFAPDGELFFTMANGAHLRHVVLPDRLLAEGRFGGARAWVDVPDHDRAFPISEHTRPPYQQIDFVGGFTGAAGCLVYSGGAWPEEFVGDHFVTEPTLNIVHQDELTPAGTTFRASKPREAEFLAARDLWFRPVHLRAGPDGAMYVLDWYNQAAVHNDTRGPEHGPTNAAVRPDRDHLHGRIWRVQHRAAPRLAQPDLSTGDPAELVAALGHPNSWQRWTAQRLLADPAVTTAATARLLAPGEGLAPEAALHRAWVRFHQGLLTEAWAFDALLHGAPALRKNAARIAGLAGWGRAEEARDGVPGHWLLQGLQDPDPRVRLEVLVAVGTGGPPAATERAALVSLWPALEDDASRSMVLRAAARAPVAFVEALLEQAGARRPSEVALVRALAERVARGGDPDETVALVCAAAGVAPPFPGAPPDPGPVALPTGGARELLGATLRALGGVALPAEPARGDDLARVLAAVLDGDDLELAIDALPLAGGWAGAGVLRLQVERFAARLRDDVEDWDAAAPWRVRCFETLLAMPDRAAAAAPLGEIFLDPFFAPELQLRAIAALDTLEAPAAARVLLDAYPSLSNAGREAAFNALARRAAWSALVLDRVERGDLSLNDLGPARGFRLRNHPDAAVAARATALFDGLRGAARRETDAILAELLPIVTGPGDPARGAELFTQNCATCHTYQGAGAQVGPDLTGMGVHGPAELLPFVVDPNRTVEDAYVEYVARTVDGRTEGGVLVEEGPDSIVLRNTSGDVRIPRVELEELRSTGRSPMPVGLEELGADALRDVFAYLCAGHGGFRVVGLGPVATASSERGMYDERREPRTYEFERFGVHEVDGIPFEVLDPVRSESGNNLIVLKGGLAADWDCKTRRPARVEVPVGYALERVHVLGGVAAWGYPYTREKPVCVRWTWRYADGTTESAELVDGVHFADWIGRHDVPGSKFVEGPLRRGSRGQLRRFSLAPSRPEAELEAIVLESFDNQTAPTFLALTAQLEPDALPADALWDAGAALAAAPPPAELAPVVAGGEWSTVLFAGGASHDFARWYGDADVRALGEAGFGPLWYDELPARLAPLLAEVDLAILCNNQPLPEAARTALFEHVTRGGGLLLLHPATWYNWSDWPEYNRQLVGGGARSHEALGEFEVRVVAPEHPITAGLPARFRVTDELYRFERDPAGAGIEVLAEGVSLETGAVYPVAWTVASDAGRVACVTLGHDGRAHELAAYRKLLRQAAAWTVQGR